jgi:MFS family permease
MSTTASPAPAPLWRDRAFATYWFGQGVSEFGDRVSELALPLIAVTYLHATPLEVGVVTGAVWAPHLISLVVGSWVDQRPRKKAVLVGANLVQAASIASLPIVYAVGTLTLVHLCVAALVAGAGRVFYQTAYASFFVHLVRKDRYLTANSLLSSTRSASFVVGPAVGGLLIQALTAPIALLVDAISFLVSAAAIGRVRVVEPAPEPSGEASLLTRAREGMGFVVHHAYLRASLTCCTCLNFFSFLAGALVILYASRVLGLTPGLIGLTFGAGASGGLLGAALASRVSRRIGVGHAVAVGGVVFCAPLAAIPLAAGAGDLQAALVLAAVEFVAGAGIMVFDINLNALQAAVTPDRMRSRAAGAFSTVNYGIRPLGAALGGIAGEMLGIAPTLVLGGIGGSLSVLFLWRSPIIRTRTIEELEPVEAASTDQVSSGGRYAADQPGASGSV